MTTRALVLEKREDGSSHVLSLPTVGWQIYDMPPRQESPEELADEIGLMMSDAGVGPEPWISLDKDGQLHHLIWPDEVERVAETLALALDLPLRRVRRQRRSLAKARARKARKPPQPKRKDVVELERRGGRWRRAPGDDLFVVTKSALDAVAEHAREVHRARPGHESFGALVADSDGHHVLRYVPLHNPSAVPGHVVIRSPRQLARRPDGLPLIPVHSHPPLGPTVPSPRDIQSARRFGWECFGVFSRRDGLRLFRPDGDGVAEVTLVIE